LPLDPSIFLQGAALRQQNDKQLLDIISNATGQDKQGNTPAALQIADEYQKARASGDVQRMNDIVQFTKSLDKGVVTDANGNPLALPGYGDAVGSIAGTKKGYEQQAQKGVDLLMNPQIAAGESNARNQSDLTYGPMIEVAKAQATEGISNTKTLPIIDQIRGINAGTFDMPYSGSSLGITRLIPGKETQSKVTNTDLLKQARLDLAAPLAKQLGVNPTDKDFQASLDRIFNLDASKESRAAQIDALQKRIETRQNALGGSSSKVWTVKSEDEAMRLPVGAKFTLPDGRTGTVQP